MTARKILILKIWIFVFLYKKMYLSILANAVAQANKARLELIRSQAANSVLVEVVEAAAELVELLLNLKIRSKFSMTKMICLPQ